MLNKASKVVDKNIERLLNKEVELKLALLRSRQSHIKELEYSLNSLRATTRKSKAELLTLKEKKSSDLKKNENTLKIKLRKLKSDIKKVNSELFQFKQEFMQALILEKMYIDLKKDQATNSVAGKKRYRLSKRTVANILKNTTSLKKLSPDVTRPVKENTKSKNKKWSPA